MLYYIPLERYPERYTHQLMSWTQRAFNRHKIKATTLLGNTSNGFESQNIKTGVVLDGPRRCEYSYDLCNQVIRLMGRGDITKDDILFFDDFWHPGIEGVFYNMHLMNCFPRVYSKIYAQSVDQYDFTYPMRNWMRHFEKGIASMMDGIFVASSMLNTFVSYGIMDTFPHSKRVHTVGLAFDSEQVKSMMNLNLQRKNQVVYSSRFDREKNPMFFLDVADKVLSVNKDCTFVICTGQPTLRSNQPGVMERLWDVINRHDRRLEVYAGLTKEQYYRILCESKVQFNCASQDWVSYTLLEAVCAGCYPLYPNFRSFPETLNFQKKYLYDHLNENSDTAAGALASLLGLGGQKDLWTPGAIKSREWIYRRHDLTNDRILNKMGLIDGQFPSTYLQDPSPGEEESPVGEEPELRVRDNKPKTYDW